MKTTQKIYNLRETVDVFGYLMLAVGLVMMIIPSGLIDLIKENVFYLNFVGSEKFLFLEKTEIYLGYRLALSVWLFIVIDFLYVLFIIMFITINFDKIYFQKVNLFEVVGCLLVFLLFMYIVLIWINGGKKLFLIDHRPLILISSAMPTLLAGIFVQWISLALCFFGSGDGK